MNKGKILKIHKWWASHYGTMMAFIYFVIALSPSPPPFLTFLWTFALFTVASLGIGSFGQLLNDLPDISQDVRSGSQNLLAGKSIPSRFALFGVALIVGILPWWWLPVTPVILALLACEYLLFAAYSLPPLRLKGRGMLGAAADALYAYVIPNTVAVLVFARMAQTELPLWFLVPLVCWCFFFGLERIIQHQFIDELRDEREGIATFVITLGWTRAFHVLHRVLLPLEVASLAVLIAVLGSFSIWIPVFFCVYLCLAVRDYARRSIAGGVRLVCQSSVNVCYLAADVIVARFVWRWLPLLGLAALLVHQPQYLALIPIHLLLFPEPLTWFWRTAVLETRQRFAGVA